MQLFKQLNISRLPSLILFSAAISVSLLFGFWVTPALAQNSLQVQGLGINPFLVELELTPGQSKEQVITLSNTTSEPITFTVSINDFVPNRSSGQPVFLDSKEESNPKYSLSRWITITKQPQFTIPANSNTEVAFNISVPVDAEPGTHYGGLLFGQPLSDLSVSGSAVQHKAGAIILVKLGQSEEKVQLNKFFTQKQVYTRGPIEFLATLHNYGNVHSKPKGDIAIYNMLGIQVAEVPVNPDAQIILPESARDFTQTWQNKLGFGRYTAKAKLFYGSPKLEIQSQISFWIVPVKEIILGVLIMLILGIIGYIAIGRYNRYIIKKSRNEN